MSRKSTFDTSSDVLSLTPCPATKALTLLLEQKLSRRTSRGGKTAAVNLFTSTEEKTLHEQYFGSYTFAIMPSTVLHKPRVSGFLQ